MFILTLFFKNLKNRLKTLKDFPTGVDVVVIGAGAAGLYTALSLPIERRVILITKDQLALSASDWAQGGIAAVTSPDDSITLHVQDTLRAGAGLCEPQAVEHLVNYAETCVGSLVELGVAFDRKSDANLALTREAAHSKPRVLHAADTTGRAVVSTLTHRVLERSNIHVLSQAFVLDVWVDPVSQCCQGICLVYHGTIQWLQAKAVILATGGGGQVFAHTTNPALSTGDGVAIARRAGAVLRDLEFFQFHPTALMQPDAPHFLISEAVRGEGAHLLDAAGDRFLFEYHPDGELAPRDVVSRAIFQHLQKQQQYQSQVWLNLQPIAPDRIRYRFPNIIQVCQRSGINIFQDPIPVAPAAHYWMGGIVTDLVGQTSIPGLYAVGETASTGVHGANRLASNSLLECLVFGQQFSQIQVFDETCTPIWDDQAAIVLQVSHWPEQRVWIDQIRAALPRLVWQSAGICRERDSMTAAIAQVEQWQHQLAKLPLSHALNQREVGRSIELELSQPDEQIRAWGELGNLLEVAELMLKSALFRAESRGGHYRVDYPDTNPAWQVHTLVHNKIWSKSAPIASPEESP